MNREKPKSTHGGARKGAGGRKGNQSARKYPLGHRYAKKRMLREPKGMLI